MRLTVLIITRRQRLGRATKGVGGLSGTVLRTLWATEVLGCCPAAPAAAPAVLGGTSASLASAVAVPRCRTGHLDRIDRKFPDNYVSGVPVVPLYTSEPFVCPGASGVRGCQAAGDSSLDGSLHLL